MNRARKCIFSLFSYGFNEKVTESTANIRHIYHFQMTMKDTSIEDSPKHLNVYVLTNEGDQHIFDLWEQLPRADDFEAWQNISKATVNAFEKRMESLKKVDIPFKMVIQLLITEKGKPFFKLYDTIFLP